MTDKADYTGKIRGKGLTGTGITEQLLGRHHRAKGGRLMVVASVSVAAVHEDVATGTGGVDYVIDDLEVAPSLAEEHIRGLVKSFHYERKLEEDGPMLDDDGLTPKITDAIAAGQQHAAHPFLPTDAADDNGSCEVCGLADSAAPHRAYQVAQQADPFEPSEEESDEVWARGGEAIEDEEPALT